MSVGAFFRAAKRRLRALPRVLSDIELAWRNLEKGKRYHYPERGWTGHFQGEPSDSFIAWMVFDEVGQCGVDPRMLVPCPSKGTPNAQQ
jgi:hypothetical protein